MPLPRRSQALTRRLRLLSLLSDGEFRSGEKLAKRLRVSRGGVWKLIHTLQDLGIEIESVARQGYRLPRPVDLLEREALLQAISPESRAVLDNAEVMLTVDSTNRHIYDTISLSPGRAHVCIAEIQTAGRGRRGRTWMSPFGCGISMSVGWQFHEAPPTFSALSLAIGVAVVKALRRFGASDVGLKWPNDLIWKNRKLGGVLIEMRGETGGPSTVVIGMGLNMRMPATVRLALAEQQAALITDVHEILGNQTPSRSALAGAIADEVIGMLQIFATQGFEPFVDEWRRLDTLAHASVKVINGMETITGIASGVEVDGALLVDVNGELRRFVSGEVSLRAVAR
ncbi:biotin--[acetyl-CoA-carboxylase] ligase [Povalibacter sp.]|uniref:biotin--[acetyl-CoA-carboxylase] ligase n=1 Tax=Povalibacter sp. TaxID=1962978 RepID=UPI002F4020CE